MVNCIFFIVCLFVSFKHTTYNAMPSFAVHIKEYTHPLTYSLTCLLTHSLTYFMVGLQVGLADDVWTEALIEELRPQLAKGTRLSDGQTSACM